eukprot:gene31870-54255_t
MAALQAAMGMANWLLLGTLLDVLMPDKLDFASVVQVMLLAAVAGVLTHVPAGIGVLEAVFVALLAHRAPTHQLLAALLAYRLMYYLAPLVLALLLYLLSEPAEAVLTWPTPAKCLCCGARKSLQRRSGSSA